MLSHNYHKCRYDLHLIHFYISNKCNALSFHLILLIFLLGCGGLREFNIIGDAPIEFLLFAFEDFVNEDIEGRLGALICFG